VGGSLKGCHHAVVVVSRRRIVVQLQQILPSPSTEDVMVQDAQQLCVPVAKNGQFPPFDINFVDSRIDLKCYGITDPDGLGLPSLGIPLTLTHLNPVLQQMSGVPLEESVFVREPQQLCVPVAKSLPGRN
jgi:hypothetical protein